MKRTLSFYRTIEELKFTSPEVTAALAEFLSHHRGIEIISDKSKKVSVSSSFYRTIEELKFSFTPTIRTYVEVFIAPSRN